LKTNFIGTGASSLFGTDEILRITCCGERTGTSEFPFFPFDLFVSAGLVSQSAPSHHISFFHNKLTAAKLFAIIFLHVQSVDAIRVCVRNKNVRQSRAAQPRLAFTETFPFEVRTTLCRAG
jgi:hypothetical protein